jgi:hypothetical protein
LNHGGDINQQVPQQGTSGRWDAILAERQMPSYTGVNTNMYARTGGPAVNYNNRNARENSGGGYGGQRDHNHWRRDHDSQRPYHSHVGAQSSDSTGVDWNTALPSNANLER